jgi:hypothetical protein
LPHTPAVIMTAMMVMGPAKPCLRAVLVVAGYADSQWRAGCKGLGWEAHPQQPAFLVPIPAATGTVPATAQNRLHFLTDLVCRLDSR